MTFMRRPRVFLSYRHEEKQGWFSGRYNARHRAWIGDFAKALGSWGVDVVWDDRLRSLFKPHTTVDPSRLPFLAEVSTLCLQVTQTFMPILTRGYIERIEGAGGGTGYGTVSEEWRHGIAERMADRAEIVTIVREWPIPGCSTPPAQITPEHAWDYRFVAPTRDEAELLGDVLQGLWSVERPRFDMSFSDWISSYLKFCVSEFNLPWPGIERWGCDFDRPRIFIKHMDRLAALAPRDRSAGSQRDLTESSRALGMPQATPALRADPQPAGDESESELNERAIDLVRSVMTEHSQSFFKPFDFSRPAPGGRASNGLYFGATLPGFSYLHPADPGFPG